MSGPRRENMEQEQYELYTQLVDRRACDEILSPEELEFCRTFEQRYPRACVELASYAELAKLNAVPDASSRALVDRALAQIEAEDAMRAFDEVKLLRRSRTPSWPALVAVAAFALGAAYALLNQVTQKQEFPGANAPPLARAELVYASGIVKVSGASGAAGRTLLSEGCVIETENGGACVLIDADINVCLASNSRMRLTAITSPARRVELEAGRLATRLSEQPEGMSLTIAAGGVGSTAVGTAFSVERAADQSVVTTVLNGKVRVGQLDTSDSPHKGAVRNSSTSAVVNAHERAVTLPVQRDGTVVRPAVTAVRRTEEAPSWALLGPTVLWHDPVAATLEVHGEPAGAEAWLDDQWLGFAPISTLIPVGEHLLTVRKDNRELLTRELNVYAGDTQDVRYDSVDQLRGARDARDLNDDDKPVPHAARRLRNRGESNRAVHANRREEVEEESAALSGSDLWRKARQAVRAGQYRQAAELYERLIDSRSSYSANTVTDEDAHTTLVLLGQLRLNQLHDPKGALSALDAYLKTGGALAVEARAARIEALRVLQRFDEEASAIEEFLRKHPRSFEGKALRARLAVLRPAALAP